MLLPGPRRRLATYAGWLLHGVRGGLAAGILFVLPGALVMLALSLLYTYGRGLGVVDGALFGIKAAVLVIVVEALMRIGRRALKSNLLVALAGMGFIGIYFFALPFPLIVLAAALVGFLPWRKSHRSASRSLRGPADNRAASRRGRWRQFAGALAIGLVYWWAPVALALLMLGPTNSGHDRIVLLQAGGGDLRRRLCGAGLYGATGGGDASAGSPRRKWSTGWGSPRPRRDR